MVLAAIVPMGVALVIPLAGAERRASEETRARLERARAQAEALVARRAEAAREKVVRAAEDLATSDRHRRAVLFGPAEAARTAVEDVARRNGLDALVVRSGSTLLAAHPADADLAEAASAVRVARDLGDESVEIEGAVAIGGNLVREIAEITGGSVALVGPDGKRAVEGSPAHGGPSAEVPIPLAPGFRVRVEVTPADTAAARRDVVRVAAGLAPIALVAAVLVGLLLATRVARPIRSLAERADHISRERAGAAFEVVEEPDDVRRLERAFDRMVEAFGESERRRGTAERVAAWQEVARRVAHEVKNPLSPIRLAVENLRRARARSSEALAKAVDDEGGAILEEVESLKRLVDEFSSFARLPSPSIAACDPRRIVEQSLARLADRVGSLGVRVETDFAEAPAVVHADAEQLGRALRNVLENALDAMEPVERRELRVALRTVAGGRGPVLEIRVADSGIGLDEEGRRRLFEPYWTTKADRGGTGLGMAIVYRIAAEHDGTVEVDGAPGRGAMVTLRIPCAPVAAV